MMTLHEKHIHCSTPATKPQIPRLARKGEVELCLSPAFMRGTGEPDERSRIPGRPRLAERTRRSIMGRQPAPFPLMGEVQVSSSRKPDARRQTADRTAISGSSYTLRTLAPAWMCERKQAS